MPSFWMSYIEVYNVAKAAEIASANGGKVELGPEPFEGGGEFALIRDPLGAGFTVYSGNSMNGVTSGRGARIGHGLFVSDASAVRDFYTALFTWEFGESHGGVQDIILDGKTISRLHEIPDPAIRGKEQFWGIYFCHPNLDQASTEIPLSNGEVIATVDLPEGRALLARDPDGGAFFLLENENSPAQPTVSPFPYKAWIGVALILATLGSFANIAWAVFLTIWLVTGLREKSTWLFEYVSRDDAPVLYWTLMLLYGSLAVLALISP